jgi:hypothetical protein
MGNRLRRFSLMPVMARVVLPVHRNKLLLTTGIAHEL